MQRYIEIPNEIVEIFLPFPSKLAMKRKKRKNNEKRSKMLYSLVTDNILVTP